jgi:hypothetical protein
LLAGLEPVELLLKLLLEGWVHVHATSDLLRAYRSSEAPATRTVRHEAEPSLPMIVRQSGSNSVVSRGRGGNDG